MYIFFIHTSFPTGCGSPTTILSINKTLNVHLFMFLHHKEREETPIKSHILCFFPSPCNISFMLVGKMCLHLFLFVFSQGPFQLSVFFGAFTYENPVAPSSKALCSSHDFAVRGETSTDGCGNAGCTQQTFRGETDGM